MLGVDEAGRGPVIGPLVIACFGIEPIKVLYLLEHGVQDSKKLTKEKREALYNVLIDLGDLIRIAVIPPKIIDKWVYSGEGLNSLEANTILKLLESLPQNNVFNIFIDAPSNPKNFENNLKNKGLRKFRAENRADELRPVVSAASIIAKVLRDRLTFLLHKLTKVDFGSGYPSDPKTRKALPVLLKRHPEVVRRSWKTSFNVN